MSACATKKKSVAPKKTKLARVAEPAATIAAPAMSGFTLANAGAACYKSLYV
jgi:hypothetical protein